MLQPSRFDTTGFDPRFGPHHAWLVESFGLPYCAKILWKPMLLGKCIGFDLMILRSAYTITKPMLPAMPHLRSHRIFHVRVAFKYATFLSFSFFGGSIRRRGKFVRLLNGLIMRSTFGNGVFGFHSDAFSQVEIRFFQFHLQQRRTPSE